MAVFKAFPVLPARGPRPSGPVGPPPFFCRPWDRPLAAPAKPFIGSAAECAYQFLAALYTPPSQNSTSSSGRGSVHTSASTRCSHRCSFLLAHGGGGLGPAEHPTVPVTAHPLALPIVDLCFLRIPSRKFARDERSFAGPTQLGENVAAAGRAGSINTARRIEL